MPILCLAYPAGHFETTIECRLTNLSCNRTAAPLLDRGIALIEARAAARVAFVSCNEAPWGGSEELWCRAALAMARSGHKVFVAKPYIDRKVGLIADLRQLKVPIADLASLRPLPQRMVGWLSFLSRPAMFALQLFRLWLFLARTRPDLVVLSQGGCWDGFFMSSALRRCKVPYVLICQKASDLYWPPDNLRRWVREFISGADHVYCVSQHNLTLLEEQIGVRLPSASVVRNPFLVNYTAPLPWPGEDQVLRLACVARLYTMEKGQDVLLRVLAQPKWKSRPVEVSFFGEGANAEGLADMARLLGCTQVRFRGHVSDIRQIWSEHHALVLPSRAEGLPLVLVEAMLAGRVAIISRAGGSADLVDDGTTGFLMNGYDEAGLDDAMERAWAARSRWQEMAKAAAVAVRQCVPENPALELAADLERCLPKSVYLAVGSECAA